jgi:hypothetical protein
MPGPPRGSGGPKPSSARRPRPPSDLISRLGRAVLAVRWETGGHYGDPFPVLDADLTLTPAGPSAALLELSGIHRADPGEDGPRMGAVVLGGFVDRIAETITRAGTATG